MGDGYHSKIDVMKIAMLAFGRGEAADANNLAAARQLRSICCDMCTAPAHEPEWCEDVATKALEEVLQLYYLTRDDNDNELVGAYQKSNLRCCMRPCLSCTREQECCSTCQCRDKSRTLDVDVPYSILLDLASFSRAMPRTPSWYSRLVYCASRSSEYWLLQGWLLMGWRTRY